MQYTDGTDPAAVISEEGPLPPAAAAAKVATAIRLTVWTLGLLVWFMGGIVSFGHAVAKPGSAPGSNRRALGNRVPGSAERGVTSTVT